MAMSIMPAAVLTGLSIVVNLGAAAVNVFHYHEWDVLAISALQTVMNLYLTLFVLGAVTTHHGRTTRRTARQKRHRKKYTAACRHGTGKAPKRRDYPARE